MSLEGGDGGEPSNVSRQVICKLLYTVFRKNTHCFHLRYLWI